MISVSSALILKEEMLIVFFLNLFFIFQPSHSDKIANPEVLRMVNELAKLRKELKGERTPKHNQK